MSGRAKAWIAVALAAAALAAHQSFFVTYTVDDAFINFRFARNLARGLGFVYNAGDEPVMGFVDTLWILLLAGCERLGVELVAAAKTLGALFALAALALSALLSFRIGGAPRGGFPLAPLFCAAAGPFAFWTVSGMETGLFAMLLTAAVFALSRETPSAGGAAAAGLLFALALLTRPEALGFAVVAFVVWRLVRGPEARRTALPFALALGIPALLYAAWIRASFGDPLPNPFYAKGVPTDPRLWKVGASYALDFFVGYGGPALLAVLPIVGLLRPGRGRAVAAAVAAAIAAEVFYAIAIGGDWMEGHRFFAPLLPVGFVLVERGLRGTAEALREAGWRAPRFALFGATALLLAGIAWPSRLLPQRPETGHAHASVIEWFLENVPPDARVALWDVGAIPYFTGVRVIDFAGLTDRTLTRDFGMRPFSAIPYERSDGEAVVRRVLEKAPDYIVLKMDGERPVPTELADLFFASPDFQDRYRRIPAGVRGSRYGVFRRVEGGGSGG